MRRLKSIPYNDENKEELYILAQREAKEWEAQGYSTRVSDKGDRWWIWCTKDADKSHA